MNDVEELLAANAEYYRAFNSRDFAGMSRIWADHDVSCIHPGWPALTGRDSVTASYRGILANPMQEPLEYHGALAIVSGSVGRVICVETVNGMALAVSNWFKREKEAWRMIHHQASAIAAPPQELAAPGKRLN
ncbi:MAG: nuclear transport factor 2 family protein [Rhodomicrobium sp.]